MFIYSKIASFECLGFGPSIKQTLYNTEKICTTVQRRLLKNASQRREDCSLALLCSDLSAWSLCKDDTQNRREANLFLTILSLPLSLWNPTIPYMPLL